MFKQLHEGKPITDREYRVILTDFKNSRESRALWNGYKFTLLEESKSPTEFIKGMVGRVDY